MDELSVSFRFRVSWNVHPVFIGEEAGEADFDGGSLIKSQDHNFESYKSLAGVWWFPESS